MVNINLNIQKKDLWLLSAIMVFLVGVGFIIAYGSGDPTVHGHDVGEVENAYIKVSDQVPSGVGSQSNENGRWTTKRINTINHDDGGYASISGNQITLAPGTYRVSISSPVRRNCRSHKARLRDITNDVTTLVGTSEQQHDDYSRETARSFISGQFTIDETTVFEIQHYKQSGSNWGNPTGFGEVEVYTVAEFWKVG